MPGTTNSHFLTTDNAAHYFTVGPIPPNVLLRSITLLINSDTQTQATVGFALAGTNDPTETGFRAASGLIHRTNSLAIGHCAFVLSVLARSVHAFPLPIDRRLASGARYIIVRLQGAAAEYNLHVLAIATWLDRSEEHAQFGDERRVTVVTPAAEAVAPAFPGVPPVIGPPPHVGPL